MPETPHSKKPPESPDKAVKKPAAESKSKPEQNREEKLAEALRANLRRRKKASRSRKED